MPSAAVLSGFLCAPAAAADAAAEAEAEAEAQAEAEAEAQVKAEAEAQVEAEAEAQTEAEAEAEASAAAETDGTEAAESSAEMLLLVLMARLGHIAHHAYSESEGILDDPQHCTPLPNSEQKLSVVSRKSLCKAICVIFSMMSVCKILEKSEQVPEPTGEAVSIIINALNSITWKPLSIW